MDEFLSEPLNPVGGFDTAAMATGAPGLPTAFDWRDARYTVVETLARWKTTSPEHGKAGNEVYLRRHYFKLRMSDGSAWTVYFTRQPARGGSPKTRWFLYSRAEPEDERTS